MTLWYRLLIRLLTPLAFCYFWLRGRKASAYRQRWSERLALQVIPVQARQGLLIHCVSVGETVAAKQLIEQLLTSYPRLPITLSSMTPTAADLAQRLFGERVHHLYLPIDTPGAMRRFFDKLNPRAVVILETEVWPCLLREAKRRAAPVMLLNARLSEQSLKTYQRYAWLLGPIWQQLTWVAAQDEASYRRFLKLGVAAASSQIRGNLKFDSQVSTELINRAAQLRQELGRPVLVAASTHKGEDEQLLNAFAHLLEQLPQVLLILVPRHPERFQAVGQLAERRGFAVAYRSRGEQPTKQQQIWLGDTMGELMQWYAVADVAFVGGSLIQRGGHNPLEPVATHTPVVSGRHIFNFNEIYQRLDNARAVRWVENDEQLTTVWLELLQEPEQGLAMQQRATDEFARDQGATQAMLSDVQKIVTPTPDGATTMRHVDEITDASGAVAWYRNDYFASFEMAYFDPDYWQQQQLVRGSATGRSTAWFIEHGEQGMLLRHYYRGGLVGKVNKDRFQREALGDSRAMAEFSLLLRLRELELPVPNPLAARYQQAPLWGYRADILVEVIPNAKDVFKLLGEQQLDADQWHKIGAVIRQLHDAGVYHSDLNCHNLMLDADAKAWIVDFDKCGFREAGEWQQANLARLLRSLRKEQQKAKEAKHDFHWSEARDWPLLLAGYGQRA